MSSKAATTEPIRVLTSLRFAAALWVVLHHFGAPLLPDGWEAGRRILHSGAIGVTFFFVLSGFILAVNYPHERLRPGRFLLARFARVYPVYALALVVSLPGFFNSLVATGRQDVVAEFFRQFALCTGLSQAWFPDRATLLNPPSWSLSAEALFYLTFLPALLWAPFRRFLDRVGVSLPVLWAISMIAPVWWTLAHPGLAASPDLVGMDAWSTNLVSFHPLIRLPEFLIGVALGRAHVAGLRMSRPGAIALASAVGILALAVAVPPRWSMLVHNGLAAPLFGIFVLGAAQARGRLVDFGSGAVPVFLGEASYALYILHVPVFLWMQTITGWTMPGLVGSPWLLVYFAIVLAVSSATFVWFETPARKAIRGIADRLG